VREGVVSPEDYLALLARLPDPINDAVTLGYLSGGAGLKCSDDVVGGGPDTGPYDPPG